MKDMKWYIWENAQKASPLCWNGQALEFDSQEAATHFFETIQAIDEREDMDYSNALVDKAILFWDDGYIDATNLKIVYDEEKYEHILVNM